MRSTYCFFRAWVKLHHVVTIQKVIVNLPRCCDSCLLFPPVSHTVPAAQQAASLWDSPKLLPLRHLGGTLRTVEAGNAWLSVLWCSGSNKIGNKVFFQTLCDIIALKKSSGVLNWERMSGSVFRSEEEQLRGGCESVWWKHLPQSTKTEHPFQKWMLSSCFCWDNCILPTSGSLGTSSCHPPFLLCFPVPLPCGVRHLQFSSYTWLLLIVWNYYNVYKGCGNFLKPPSKI